MNEKELKPCPFCGERSVEAERALKDENRIVE